MASSCGWPQLWHPPCHTTAARALEDVVGRQELHSREDGQQDFMRMTTSTPCPSSSPVSLIDPFRRLLDCYLIQGLGHHSWARKSPTCGLLSAHLSTS